MFAKLHLYQVRPRKDHRGVDLKEKARKLGQRVDWDKEPEQPRPPARVVASATGFQANESFGKKMRTLADRRPDSVKQAGERAEKERSRYKPLPRRNPTKGE
jgi:hypothetical protein